MTIDTKPNLNKDKFEQFTGEQLDLSGCTHIYGGMIIESGATLSMKTNAGVGKVPVSDSQGNLTLQILQAGDGVTYQGEWNAATNNPTLPNASGATGNYYVVNSGGTYNDIDFRIRDWVISDGTQWDIVRNHTAPFFLTQAEYDALTEQEKSDTSKFYLIEDEFSASGITAALNVGTGGGEVYKDIDNDTLRLRTILGSGDTTVSTSGDTIIVYSEGSGGGVWGTITGTLSDQTDLYNQLTGITAETATKLSTAVFNTYTGDTNTRISTIETNYITGATNVGAGTGTIYKQVSGSNIELRTISASGDTLISTVGDVVNIYSKCFRTTDLITTYTCGNIGLGDCLYSVNTTGNNNVAIGNCALSGNTTGNHNIAIGEGAICIKAGQNDNIGIGRCTLRNTTIGGQIAIGAQALLSNTTGCLNYAIGFNSQTCNTTGTANISYGASSLACNSTGGGNIAIGYQASLCTTATNNIAIGCNALQCQNTGSFNIGIGASSLCRTTGTGNIGVGVFTLQLTNAGNNNIGIGRESMTCRLIGNNNIGIGNRAMYNGCGGNCNIAIGINTICAVTTGNDNIAIGGNVLCATNTGCSNIGIGILALRNNTTGANNIAIGTRSLIANVSGGGNIAMGHFALCKLVSGTGNIAIGSVMTNTTGATTNVVIGSSSSTNNNGINNVVIGNQTMMSNTIGCRNVVLGAFGGYVGNITGSSNVFIGYCAGSNETGSNKLYIDNTNTATPLIYGEFDTDILKLNSCLYVRDVGNGSCSDSVLTWDASTCAVRKVPYVSGSTGGGLEWTGSTANGVGTYSSSGTICSNPNLTFDGTTMTVTGIACATTCVSSPIIVAATGVNILDNGNLNLLASVGSNDTGDIVFYSGGSLSCEWARLWASTDGCLYYRNACDGLVARTVYHSGNISGASVNNSTCLNGQLASFYAVATHTHGNINNGGCIGSTTGLVITTTTNGCLTALAAGTSGQYLAHNGTWGTPVGVTNLSLGVSSGTEVRVDSSTGSNVTLPTASSTLAGVITNAAQTLAGTKTTTIWCGSTCVQGTVLCSTNATTVGTDIILTTGAARSIRFNAAATTTGSALCIVGNQASGNAIGGAVCIIGGQGGSSTGSGGAVSVFGGANGVGAASAINICAGNTACGAGGAITICASRGCGGTTQNGGSVTISAGLGGNSGGAGGAVIVCGGGSTSTNGGHVCVMGGCGVGSGGETCIFGGGVSTGTGGHVRIIGGAGQTGGNVFICSCAGITTGTVFINHGATTRFCTTTTGVCIIGVECATTCGMSPVYCATTAFRTTGAGLRYCGGTGCGSAVDWIATSDCRIKKNITPIISALSKVSCLCGVCYEFCEDGTLDMGLIAQDVLCVEPRLVTRDEPSKNDIEKYNIIDEKFGLKYDKFAGLFVEAIKELKAQNTQLQNEINELKKKINN